MFSLSHSFQSEADISITRMDINGRFPLFAPIKTKGEKLDRIFNIFEKKVGTKAASQFFQVFVSPKIFVYEEDKIEEVLVKECNRLLSKIDVKELGKSKAEITLALLKSIEKVECFAWESKLKSPSHNFHLREPILKQILSNTKTINPKTYALVKKILRSPIVYLCPESLLYRTIMREYRALLYSTEGKRIVSEIDLSDYRCEDAKAWCQEEIKRFHYIVKKALRAGVKKHNEDYQINIRGELFFILFDLLENSEKLSESLEEIEKILLTNNFFLCSSGVLEKRIANKLRLINPRLVEPVLTQLKIARRLQIKEHLLKVSKPSLKQVVEKAFQTLMPIDSDANFLEKLEEVFSKPSKGSTSKNGRENGKNNLIDALHIVVEELKNPRMVQKKKAQLEQLYDRGEPIPEWVKSVATQAPHTLEPLEYVGNRLSRTIFTAIKLAERFSGEEKGVEIFLGSAHNLTDYYRTKGYYVHSRLGTDSSNWFFIVVHESDPSLFKVVISRIANKSRFTQVLLQLKYGGVNLDEVAVRGTIAQAKGSVRRTLESKFKRGTMKPHTVFIGARMQVVVQLAKFFFPKEMVSVPLEKQGPLAEELLSRYGYKLESIDGVITFSYIDAPMKGEKVGIVALRMPNGDLAYEAMRALLSAGAKNVIMVGVGGALNQKEGEIGSYHKITQSSYEGETLSVSEDAIIPLMTENVDLKTKRKNVTVDTPLQETEEWKREAERSGSSVDVETYHILHALHEVKEASSKEEKSEEPVRVISGLFISDIVGVQSLNEKIDDTAALEHLPELIFSTLGHLGFASEEEAVSENSCIKNLKLILQEYHAILEERKSKFELAFNGNSAETRLKYAQALHELRQKFAYKIFIDVIRPQIEELLVKHKEKKFDEIVTVYGFNRLFTRKISSVGTDIDFMLIVDTKKTELIREIRRFINLQVNPLVKNMGIEMEAADYLMTSKKAYMTGLKTTRNALFTLANLPVENRHFLTGSKDIFMELFHLDNQKLATYFTELLFKHDPWIMIEDYPAFCLDSRMGFVSKHLVRERILRRLVKEGETFRIIIGKHLTRLACLELYIGKKPYKGKETLQTIMGRVSLAVDRQERSEPFSIKFGINRFADMYFSAGLKEIKEITSIVSRDEIEVLEKLGVVLSNVICRMNTEDSPALHLHKNYSNLTLAHLENMNTEDKFIIIKLLKNFNIQISNSPRFAEECYDGLWRLAKKLDKKAKKIEKVLYHQANALVNQEKKG